MLKTPTARKASEDLENVEAAPFVYQIPSRAKEVRTQTVALAARDFKTQSFLADLGLSKNDILMGDSMTSSQTNDITSVSSTTDLAGEPDIITDSVGDQSIDSTVDDVLT